MNHRARINSAFGKLCETIWYLRGPQGCPWDKEQTHSSLQRNLLEETYEVQEAIESGDDKNLQDELGDLLVQVLLHSCIAEQSESFSLTDVINNCRMKLIRRHPHVFGKTTLFTAKEVEHQWDALKRQETQGRSTLGRVPQTLPALAYSQAVQDRAAHMGFDWSEFPTMYDGVMSRLQELGSAASVAEREKRFGDFLFDVTTKARLFGIHAESTLRDSNRRFYASFQVMEEICSERDLTMPNLSAAQKQELWNEAVLKNSERS